MASLRSAPSEGARKSTGTLAERTAFLIGKEVYRIEIEEVDLWYC